MTEITAVIGSVSVATTVRRPARASESLGNILKFSDEVVSLIRCRKFVKSFGWEMWTKTGRTTGRGYLYTFRKAGKIHLPQDRTFPPRSRFTNSLLCSFQDPRLMMRQRKKRHSRVSLLVLSILKSRAVTSFLN
jgi:hypothetical protein